MTDMANITALPSGSFRVRIEHRGGVASGTVATTEEAVALRDELKRQIVDGELAPVKGASAAKLGTHFLNSRRGNRAVKDDEGRWHKRIAHAAWAHRPVATVTRKDGQEWLAALANARTEYDAKKHGKRAAKVLSWQSRKHLLNLARAFFGWCVDQELVPSNPFAELSVQRQDGDEDEGYQDSWYLDLADQRRFLEMWDRVKGLDARDRSEKWMVAFAMALGLREGEQWCLHLADVHADGDDPHVVVRFGSWDPVKERYRPPKGRKGEKKSRRIPLWGLGLEAAKRWLKLLPTYAPKNPLGLMFPTERGARRNKKPPRSWAKVVAAFGVVPRIGREPWWHLLRHTCASSLVSGWWGMRWALEDVQKILGHTDLRTTQIYAHLAPSAVQGTADRAHAAYGKVIPIGRHPRRHAAVTTNYPDQESSGKTGHAREDSNLRPTAPEAVALSS